MIAAIAVSTAQTLEIQSLVSNGILLSLSMVILYHAIVTMSIYFLKIHEIINKLIKQIRGAF